jgi:DNA-binding protein YbaB
MKEKILELKNLIRQNKKVTSISVIFIILILFIGYTGYFDYGIGMSDKQKTNRINSIVLTKNYTKAKNMNNVYFKGTDEQSIATNKLILSTINVCESTNASNLEEAMSQYKDLKEKVDSLKIIKTEIVHPKYSSNYENIEITVQNNGKENVSYVKIGLDFKDKNGNVIQSDWTNDNSIIKPNSTQKLTKMVSKDIKYDTVQSEVLDFK